MSHADKDDAGKSFFFLLILYTHNYVYFLILFYFIFIYFFILVYFSLFYVCYALISMVACARHFQHVDLLCEFV